MFLRLGLLTFFILFLRHTVWLQCNTTITSFPYVQNFEQNEGGWTTGGNASSWAYGTPNKNIINSAASGTKCFITGGLTNASYNNAENSWLMSPCFNFSNLTNPQISFNIFWETERRFDGASFQYSTDGGNSWQILGSANSNSSCLGENWFNFNPITALGISGWSGTILPNSGNCLGTGGSDGWTTAKHTLSMLAGQANVRFRFLFGAGTACNNYNGFAVDDIVITDVTNNTADFIYTCSPNKQVQFNAVVSGCVSSYAWNFGDVNAPSNTSNAQNPQHTFSAPGTYTITLTVTVTGGGTVTKTKDISIIDINIGVVNTIKCFGNAGGSLIANVTGGSGSYSYLWNTNPPQNTAIANNLIAGNYTVTVSGNNVCATTAAYQLNQPAVLTGTVQTTNELCKQNNGAATISVNGGTTPYTYLWSNNATTPTIANVKANSYTITATDANGCKLTLPAIVKDSMNILSVNLGNDTTICKGETLTLKPGTFNSYLWQDLSVKDSFKVVQTGVYYVTVTDKDGCKASDTIKVNVDCSDIYFPTAFTPNNDGLNDFFGAIGNVSAVTQFSLIVYGRWGQIIFKTNNPKEKWDGKFKGEFADMGVYIWVANYSINNQPPKTQKNTVTLLR